MKQTNDYSAPSFDEMKLLQAVGSPPGTSP